MRGRREGGDITTTGHQRAAGPDAAGGAGRGSVTDIPQTPRRRAYLEAYRALPALSADDLVGHTLGRVRVVDGRTHQTWDWTNADVHAHLGPVFARRFGDAGIGEELGEGEGFDRSGNRVRRGPGGSRRVLADAGDRFNDIRRELDGTRIYGSGQGLELPELQVLRIRYQRLERDEADRATVRRFQHLQVAYVLFLIGLLAALVAVSSTF